MIDHWRALLWYIFVAFGVAYVIGLSKISLPIRSLVAPKVWSTSKFGSSLTHRSAFFGARRWLIALIECPACLGFWIGAVSSYYGADSLLPFDGTWPWWLDSIVLGLFTCCSNLLLATFVMGRNE